MYWVAICQRPVRDSRQDLQKVWSGLFPQTCQYLEEPSFKDKDDITQKCNVIYQLACSVCGKKYTSRSLGVRRKGHLDPKSAKFVIAEHFQATGYRFDIHDCKIFSSEEHFWKRKIKEAITIRRTRLELNRDQGYQLSRVYQSVLLCDVTSRHMTTHRQCETVKSLV